MGNRSLIYYSQEDPRWKNILYSNHRDPKQTIAASGCGPTCFAMVASSFTNRPVLPPETAKYAIDRGFRTDDNGTDWGYFASAAKAYGLTCKQTGNLDEIKQVLVRGALVIGSLRAGHFTGAGHYILLVGIQGEWIDVYDPNPDNRRYGADGLIAEGIKDDGRVTANQNVFRKEAAQYWIFTPKIEEEDQPMTAEERVAFEKLTKRIEALETLIEAPTWFVKEFGSADLGGRISDPHLSEEGWKVLAIGLRFK